MREKKVKNGFEVTRYLCNKTTNLLRAHGLEFKRTDFKTGCTIDFEDPQVSEKVKKILEEEGVPDPEVKYRWSSVGSISFRYDPEFKEVEVECEIPVVQVPDEFRYCKITPPRLLNVEEIHPHAFKGHSAVHIHYRGKFPEEEVEEDLHERIIDELRYIIRDLFRCRDLALH